MCEEFYDVRMFGAVMSDERAQCGVKCAGPMQLTFARSIDAIVPLDSSIVGPAQKRSDVNREDAGGGTTNFGTMGRKSTVPYGLYRAHGFFNPHFAEQTGVDEEDLRLFWNALEMMWDVDRSATRGEMACRGLFVFSHESKLGNAAAHRLFDLIRTPKSGSEAPRSFSEYSVERPADGSVDGIAAVTLTTLVG